MCFFKEQVKQQYPLSVSATESRSLPPLAYQECNAIRYAAGYVVRHLRQRLERGSHPLKEELVLCLVDMCTDNEDDSLPDWTRQISRGGLKVVNQKIYHLFLWQWRCELDSFFEQQQQRLYQLG